MLIPKWQEKLDGKKRKSVFLPLKVPKMTKIVSPKTGNELAEEAGRMTSQIAQSVCLSGLVKCLSDETYIFLANIDIQ